MAMKFLNLFLAILVLAAAIPAAAQTNNSDAQAAFDRLKQLQGEWEAKSADGKTEHISYRLIAAGSAVQEVYSGAHGDMLTVYTLDGNRVLLTHYCMAHNQPRMAASRLENGELDFQFLDATGLDSPATGHMHNASFHFTDENHFSQNWHFVENGKEKFNENIEYARLR
jgi:hypothetical protein